MFAATAAVCLLLCGASGGAARHLESEGVRVAYHPGDAGMARQAAAAVAHACARIERELGISFSGPVNVSLARGREEFNRACGRAMPEWSLAAALQGRNRIVVDAALAVPATANDLNLALLHEMVHLALGSVEGDRQDRLPLWFHEGVATWLSGQRHLRTDYGTFALAAAEGTLIPFDDLAQGFPTDARKAELAYMQSEAFIAHVAQTRSPEAIGWIVDRYRRGEAFDEAFRNALGEPRAAMERQWAEGLQRRFPWMSLLWRSITLMGLLAVATIIAYGIVRLRARRQHRSWERDEAWAAVLDEDEGEEESGP